MNYVSKLQVKYIRPEVRQSNSVFTVFMINVVLLPLLIIGELVGRAIKKSAPITEWFAEHAMISVLIAFVLDWSLMALIGVSKEHSEPVEAILCLLGIIWAACLIVIAGEGVCRLLSKSTS